MSVVDDGIVAKAKYFLVCCKVKTLESVHLFPR